MHGGSDLVQQRGVLECALPTADHDDLLSSEPTQVVMFAGMRDQCGGQIGQGFGAMGVVAEAGGHDDNRALYGAPIFKPEPKVVALMLDGGHIRFVDVRHGPILEPLGIVDERLDR